MHNYANSMIFYPALFFENSNNHNMQAIGGISLILVDWFNFIGLLDRPKSYSPGMLACSTLGLQASIFVLYCS